MAQKERGVVPMRTLIVSLILILTPSLVFARGEGQRRIGPMDVIKYKGSSYETVGYIIEENEDSITVTPEKGGRIMIRRELIAEIVYGAQEPKWILSDEMVEGFTSQLLKLVEERSSFHVAKVTDQKVYLDTGKGKIDRRGWKANIYREGEEIIDSITGDILGYEKHLVGAVQIIGETENYSEALPVKIEIGTFREGDVGVFLRKKPTLAVADITTVDGKESPYGMMISEAIIGKLSGSKNLTISERKQIGQVLEELAIQHAMLDLPSEGSTIQEIDVSDAEMLIKMRALAEADALLVGTVGVAKEESTVISRKRWGDDDVTKTRRATVSIRILHTKTGVVLYGAQYLVSYVQRPIRVDGDYHDGDYRGYRR